MNGLVLIDKAGGLTSHDVVNRWRKLAGTRRVGHLGTLDPMATGLLAVLTGPGTRLAPFLEREDKTYEAVIRLGATSDTYDAEGEVVETGAALPAEESVLVALEAFRGKFAQRPPAVSAKKIAGVPAYKLARKKLPVELKPVDVEVKRLLVRRMDGCRLEIELTCSAGTYVRSIAHELGEQLGCGALLERLRRTAIGAWSISEARTLEELAQLARANELERAVIPAAELLAHLPAERVDELAEMHIRQGRQFHTSPFVVPPGSPIVRVLSRSGELIAIGKLIIPNLYHPGTVFARD